MKLAFDHCASDYARCRPTYPDAVFEALSAETGPPAKGSAAADVGAGTGIFTRRLASFGWRVAAVEPSVAMLAHLADGDAGAPRESARVTEGSQGRVVWRVAGAAEALPLAGASVELVTAAQAFHWFNPPHALAEFARALKPGGVLALTWNNRDRTRSPFVGGFDDLVSRYNPSYDREYREQDWAAKIALCGAFEPVRYHHTDHDWSMPQEDYVGFSRSASYVRNVLSNEQRPRFEDDLRRLMIEHFGRGPCVVPLRNDLWTARRR